LYVSATQSQQLLVRLALSSRGIPYCDTLEPARTVPESAGIAGQLSALRADPSHALRDRLRWSAVLLENAPLLRGPNWKPHVEALATRHGWTAEDTEYLMSLGDDGQEPAAHPKKAPLACP